MISRQLHSFEESALVSLLEKRPLTSANDLSIFNRFVKGHLPESAARAFLVLLAGKGETTAELQAAWQAIRAAEKSVAVTNLSGVLDTCGTGGDGSHSINLSTLSSFVMAAAGVRVLKHGNRAITSRCGSSDLLEAFGMNLNQAPNSSVASAKKLGMGYFHAPHVHPTYAKFQKLRKGILIRTLFNLLGPVLNPVAVEYQILGIAAPQLLNRYADLLPRIGRKSALIVLGAEGMDEITTLGVSTGVLLQKGKTKKWQLNPFNLGFKKGTRAHLQIESISHAKRVAVQVLKNGVLGTVRDSIILSAACGIWLTGKSSSIAAGIRAANHAIDNRKAWATLNQMVKFSKQ